MEKQKEFLNKIDDLTKRVELMETKLSKLIPIKNNKKLGNSNDNFYTTDVLQKYFKGSPFVEPEDVKENVLTFAGKYVSKNYSIQSTFGACISSIDHTLNNYENSEMANIINAYANEERLNIIKLLLQNSMTAKEIMDKLSFKTTGKLYHHLSILENLGIIYKKNEVYHIQGYAIGVSIMMLDSAARLIRRFEENNKNNS